MTRLMAWVFVIAACGGDHGHDAGPDAADGGACPDTVEPTCYSRDPETLGIGVCQAGVPRCEADAVVECFGEVPPQPESCDGRDNDCDSEVDEGVCRHACIGIDCDRPWGAPPVKFVVGPHDGMALELSQDDPIAVLWVPEQNSGTLAKVDTRTRSLLARYQVVPEAAGCPIDNQYPNNIAVDPDGNVYLTTNGFTDGTATVSRVVSIAHQSCEDRDRDGQVETSGGGDDILPFLDDECVRWSVELDPVVETSIAVERRALRTGDDWLLWIALFDTERVFAMDPITGDETGSELFLPDDARPRSIDFDARGLLYTRSAHAEIALIDTATLGIRRIATGSENEPGDMVQDHRGRVWLTGYLQGYDVEVDEWIQPSIYGGMNDGPSTNGCVVAPTGVLYADTNQFINGAEAGEYLPLTYDIESDHMEVDDAAPTVPSSFALDRDGLVWQIERGPRGASPVDCGAARQPGRAWVLDPWTGEREEVLEGELWGSTQFLDNPTGVNPIDVVPGPRWAVWTLAGCDLKEDGRTSWGSLDWDAFPVEGGHIELAVQPGDELEWGPDRPWFVVGEDPHDSGPVPLDDVIADPHPYLHVRATLWSDGLVPPFESPELLRIAAGYQCPDDVD